MMRADGSEPTALFKPAEKERFSGPCWSHEGALLAFCSNRGGNEGLYCASNDAPEPVDLSRSKSNNREPDWSPTPVPAVQIALLPESLLQAPPPKPVIPGPPTPAPGPAPGLAPAPAPSPTMSGPPAGGVQAVLATTLGAPLGLAPIRAAAERAGCKVLAADENEIRFQFAGMSNDLAIVRQNGEILIAGTKKVEKLADIDTMDADLVRVYSYIEQVSPPIPAENRNACLYYDRVYYLSNPDVFKRVFFPPGEYDGNLNVPDCRVKEARVVVEPVTGSSGRIFFRGKQIYQSAYNPPKQTVIDISPQFVFGAHRLQVGTWHEWFKSEIGVAIEALTAPTPANVYFDGNNLEKVIVQRVRPLEEIYKQPEATAPAAAGE
jgi:hypothetical protein